MVLAPAQTGWRSAGVGEANTVRHYWLCQQSIRRIPVPAVAMLALCLVVGGCGQEKAETKLPPVLSKAKKGYAYLPALMPAHPLYGELGALQHRIDTLRAGELPALAAQIGQQWDSPIIVPPTFDEGLEALELHSSQWRRRIHPVPGGALEELPSDLQARLSWEVNRLEWYVSQQLAEARAQESQWLAQVQVEAVQRRQTEVSNRELDLNIPTDEAREKANELRQNIVEEVLAEAVPASEARLRELGETLEKQKQEALAQVQHELRQRAQQRRSYSTAPSGRLQGELANRMEQFAGPVGQYEELLIGASPSADQLLAADELRQAASREYQRAMSAQVDRLIAQQVDLIVAIAQATRRAAARVAWEQNLELYLLPGDSKVGEDLTPLTAEKLAAMWASQASLTQEGKHR